MQQSKPTHGRPDSWEKLTSPAHPGDPPGQETSAEQPTAASIAEPGENAPFWLPRGDAWRRLPEPIRRAVHQRILPMWKELVDGAADELERSAAATLVYLTWLEIRGQIELEQARGDSDLLSAVMADPERLFAQHMQLLKAKHRSLELLGKLRLAREKSACRQSAAGSEPSPLFFDRPLGPRRCFPWKGREPRVESPEPEEAKGQDRAAQLPTGNVQGDPRRPFDRKQDHMDPPSMTSRSEQGVSGRQTFSADERIPQTDAQPKREESPAPLSRSGPPGQRNVPSLHRGLLTTLLRAARCRRRQAEIAARAVEQRQTFWPNASNHLSPGRHRQRGTPAARKRTPE